MERAKEILAGLNRYVVSEMSKEDVHLIGNIPFNNEEYNNLSDYLSLFLEQDFNYYSELYKELLVLLLVKNAERNYSGDFWSQLKFDFKNPQRKKTRELYFKVCKHYNFPTFRKEAEAGYSIITPYICHSGITNDELPDFFNMFEKNFDVRHPDDLLNMFTYRPYIRPHTKRFFDHLKENALSFLLQWYEVTEAYSLTATEEDIMERLNEEFEGEDIIIPVRYVRHYLEWQSFTDESTTTRRKRKDKFLPPYVSLDLDTYGLILNIPDQKISENLDSGYNDKLIWVAEVAGQVIQLNTYIYKNTILNKSLTDERTHILKENREDEERCKEINIQLFHNTLDRYLASWTLPFMQNAYLVFDKYGRLISDFVVGEECWVLLSNDFFVERGVVEYECSAMFWPSFKLLNLSFNSLSEIVLSDEADNKIYISKKKGFNIPELIGGELFQNNISIFQNLPLLLFPENPNKNCEIQLDHRESKKRVPIEACGKTVNLAKSIETDQYGTFHLRVKQNNRTIYKKKLYYIPSIKVNERGGYWPTPGKGYESNIYQFDTLADLQIKIDGASIENDYVKNGKRTTLLNVDQTKTQYNGIINMTFGESERNTSIPFTMMARPIVWSIESHSENMQLEYTGEPIHLTQEKINELLEPYLFLATGDLGATELQCELLVLEHTGSILLDHQFYLRSNQRFSYPLMNILQSDILRDLSQYQIALKLYDPDGNTISGSHYPILTVSPTVETSDFKVDIGEYDITFSWQELSEPTERGLYLFDLTRPWENEKYFPIYSNNTFINLQRRALKPGIYSARIDSPIARSLFSNLHFEPTDWTDENVYHIPGTEDTENSLTDFNFHWINYLIWGEEEHHNSHQLTALPDINETEIAMMLAKSYLTLRVFESKRENLASDKIKRYKTVDVEYRKLARITTVPTIDLLKSILEADFTQKQYPDIFSFFELLQLEDEEIKAVNWVTIFREIEEIFPDLAFQISMAKNEHYESVVKWISFDVIKEILELDKSEDPVSVMQKHHDEARTDEKWARHPDYLGSYQDVYECFQAFYKDMNRAKFKNMTEIEYIDYYEKTHKKNTRKLFNKSYIRKRQDLHQDIISNEKEYFNLLEQLDICISDYVKPHFAELRSNYPMALDQISNIMDIENLDSTVEQLIYNIYLIMFAVTLIRQGKWDHEKGSLFRNANRIRRYCLEMYQHTLVVFDLYLRDGGR